MINIKELMKDEELWEEFLVAYAIASCYRERVSFRYALLCNGYRIVMNNKIYDVDTNEVLIDVDCNSIEESLIS